MPNRGRTKKTLSTYNAFERNGRPLNTISIIYSGPLLLFWSTLGGETDITFVGAFGPKQAPTTPRQLERFRVSWKRSSALTVCYVACLIGSGDSTFAGRALGRDTLRKAFANDDGDQRRRDNHGRRIESMVIRLRTRFEALGALCFFYASP